MSIIRHTLFKTEWSEEWIEAMPLKPSTETSQADLSS